MLTSASLSSSGNISTRSAEMLFFKLCGVFVFRFLVCNKLLEMSKLDYLQRGDEPGLHPVAAHDDQGLPVALI
jgi:hypothetical protein